MARTKRSTKKQDTEIQDYRHDDATRKNNPPAGIASHGRVQEQPKQEYAYNPHLPPSLRFDESGNADQLPELLEKAQQEPLSAAEVQSLAAALRHHGPWLEWSGKQEAKAFTVDPVALHIHEHVSAKAVVKIAERENIQRELFADPQQEYREAVQFYQHDVDWRNRLILGDSLTVMSSLAQREDLAGKVQMIYIDPPYGIKFASNFQPTVFKRDVTDRAGDLTREREQIKAYRDTWTLGVHSYLAYLRDRLIVAKELLTDSGSVFVQISDENVHRVRNLMDEVFGSENFCCLITFRKAGSERTHLLSSIADYIIWYAKSKPEVQYREVYLSKHDADVLKNYRYIETDDGFRQSLNQSNEMSSSQGKLYQLTTLMGAGHRQDPTLSPPFRFEGVVHKVRPGTHWRTTDEGMHRLAKANRIVAIKNWLQYVHYLDDFSVYPSTNIWTNMMGESDKIYVVQTTQKAIERCLLMTTDPGDLVLDPTCVRKGTKIFSAQDPNPPVSPRKRGEEFSSPLPSKSDKTLSSPPVEGKQIRQSSPPLEGNQVKQLSPPLEGNQVKQLSPPLEGKQVRQSSPPLEGKQIRQSSPPLEGNQVKQFSPPLEGNQVKQFSPPLEGNQVKQFSPPLEGNQVKQLSPPLAGGPGGVNLTPIENLRPGAWVLSHTGKPRRIRRVIRKPYRGRLIGIQHTQSSTTLWVTVDHYIRCKQRILSYGKECAWNEVPASHFGRARELRREMTSAEKVLWGRLRGNQLGVKFRKQHPIGPYITDFYARDMGLIIEVDGDTRFTHEAKSYDSIRTDYLRQLGLTVLRFTNLEILRQLDGVIKQIYRVVQTVHPSETPMQQWRRSDTLRAGDTVYFGIDRQPVEIINIQHINVDEEVYDLEVETDHSYLTEVCAVHNCGSGTTAYVAENWGRRWITIDTSRVAVALARQRLLTGTFDYYKLKNEAEGIGGGFINKRVPHITLRSIAQNTALDPIFAKHEPILKEKLGTLNTALAEVTPEIRTELLSKLAEKERREGKRAITDADRRRWHLPQEGWQEWEVPFDTDPDWPQALREALTDYREAFRAKMEEVNACIAASSDGEELVDQPAVDRKKLRVSGPFTVEAVQPAETSLDADSPIDGEPIEELDTFDLDDVEGESTNAEAYLDQMIRLLRNDGVRFPNDQQMKFGALDPLEDDILHAEGSWEGDAVDRNVAVVFGPQHGPVTAMQVEECLPIASRRGYLELIFAGFSFDGTAQAIIQDDPHPRVRIHIAHINPDVTMGDLLKETPSSQLFTVFGSPRTEIETTAAGEYIVRMEGVDIYNPVENTVSSAGGDKVAAWFLDSDYDGRTFCITQAFFPDRKAWDKIARALKGVIDADRFEKFSGTESLPFPAGEHQRVAVKVIDPRGNEVMRVHDLRETRYA